MLELIMVSKTYFMPSLCGREAPKRQKYNIVRNFTGIFKQEKANNVLLGSSNRRKCKR